MPEKAISRPGKLLKIVSLILLLSGILLVWYHVETRISPPPVPELDTAALIVKKVDSNRFTCGKGWFRLHEPGTWDLYLEGSAWERGVTNGKLTRSLIAKQEKAFVDRIRTMIPSGWYLKFLKYFIYWFNRNLDQYVPLDLKQEIYGISCSASPAFNYIGSPYQRLLNYHSAHDIGHALQSFALVGCTSFGAWGGRTADSTLLIGRNFDFYMGDAFARDRIVCFEKPDSGYAFMMVTWAGMAGAVSGMNVAGVTVTINADRSEIPWSARTPVSIVAREILQYAGNLDEAYRIACRYPTFVSESFLVGSAADGKAVVLEKTPKQTVMLESPGNLVTCTNHFQSDALRNDPINQEELAGSPSLYRSRRLRQVLDSIGPLTVPGAAFVLRDPKGLDGRDIGLGNEKSINQLIAHHSIMFQPAKRLVWVSSGPWHSGSYICYDLNEIFNIFAPASQQAERSVVRQDIPADPFLGSAAYKEFRLFQRVREQVRACGREGNSCMLSSSYLNDFIALNPSCSEGYQLAGDVLLAEGRPDEALRYYRQALSCEIPRTRSRQEIIRKMAECIYQLKHQA